MSEERSIWLLLAPGLVGAVIGFLSAVFSEPIRFKIFRPRLKVSFDPETCVIKTPTVVQLSPRDTKKSTGFYVRIRVEVKKDWLRRHVARGCRAYLVKVERKEGGNFKRTNFADSLPLKWSSRREEDSRKPLDIPRGIVQHVDIVSTHEHLPEKMEWLADVQPLYCADLFDSREKTLRLTILVTGDEVEPVSAQFIFGWHGRWDNLSFRGY